MQVEIIPEALELMDFYNSKLEYRDVVKIVKEQNRRHGRFGLTRIGKDSSENRVIRKYWEIVRRHEDEIRKERDFVNEILKADDLEETIEGGLEKAKSVFYKKEFKNPVVKLTAGIDYGDARLLCRNSFGINLSHIFGNEPNVNMAKKHIESYSAHESNHLFLYQTGFRHGVLDKERVKSIVFMEGLATFLEIPEVLETRDTHKTCIKDIKNWENLLQEYLGAENCSVELLRRLTSQESFRKLNPRSSLIKKVSKLKDFVDINLYEDAIYTIFVNHNGPAYHIGYNMWKRIGGIYGTEKVKEVVARGPDEFFRVYEEIKS
jgi:hypothetical protein